MDKIFIHDLCIAAIIGTKAEERLQPQPLIFDLDITVDIAAAAASDDIIDALDYEKLVQRLKTFVAATHYQLLETLAQKVADFIVSDAKALDLRLCIRKPQALADTPNLGIVVTR